MTEYEKLTKSLDCVKQLVELLENNEYESYLYSRLISLKFEVERQLTNIESSANI
jgi:hypothetical protein